MPLPCRYQHRCFTSRTAMLMSVVLVLTCFPLLAMDTALRGDEISVLQLVQRFIAARSQSDVNTLSQITAEQYVEVSPTGAWLSRKDMLAAYSFEHKTPAPENLSSEWNVRLFRDTGVVVSRFTYDLKAASSDSQHVELRVIYVAQHFDGGWRLLSAQFTPIAPLGNPR